MSSLDVQFKITLGVGSLNWYHGLWMISGDEKRQFGWKNDKQIIKSSWRGKKLRKHQTHSTRVPTAESNWTKLKEENLYIHLISNFMLHVVDDIFKCVSKTKCSALLWWCRLDSTWRWRKMIKHFFLLEGKRENELELIRVRLCHE